MIMHISELYSAFQQWIESEISSATAIVIPAPIDAY